MAQILVNGEWTDSGVHWSSAPEIGANPPDVMPLLACYEEGNIQAQGGDLPKALALFQKGVSGFLAIAEPGPHHRNAEAACLWGLGTTLDRTEHGQDGWRTLREILRPGSSRPHLPLGLAINWSHSMTVAGYRHDQYLDVCRVLDGLQRLGWGPELAEAPPEARQAVQERYRLLSSFRARCFEGLMQEGRFSEALQVAQAAGRTLEQYQPDQTADRELWQRLEQAAQAAQPNFSLEDLEWELAPASDPEQTEPVLRLRWDGHTPVQWRAGPAPEDPRRSALIRVYAEASQLAAQGESLKALQLFDKGLQSWAQLKHPRTCDAVVRCMLLLGKASIQDSLATFDSAEAWRSLMQISGRGIGTALPLPLVRSWVQASVVVGSGLRLIEEVIHLLAFLIELSRDPDLTGSRPELSAELVQQFLILLEGAYGGLESSPGLAADWLRALQKRVEHDGLILIPLRELLYHALTQAGRRGEADAVATEVLIWARQEGVPETIMEWELRTKAAQGSASLN